MSETFNMAYPSPQMFQDSSYEVLKSPLGDSSYEVEESWLLTILIEPLSTKVNLNKLRKYTFKWKYYKICVFMKETLQIWEDVNYLENTTMS